MVDKHCEKGRFGMSFIWGDRNKSPLRQQQQRKPRSVLEHRQAFRGYESLRRGSKMWARKWPQE